jgi:endonuclease
MEKRQVILESPNLEEGLLAVRLGISRHKTIVIAGNCHVDYEGRANSKLESGERLSILKPDGSALVHRPRDYPPVNWQPPGSLYKTSLLSEGLVIRVYRRKDNEVMVITYTTLIMVAILDLRDSGDFNLYASERDMQQAILLQPSLLEEGFQPVAHEHSVDPGFIDILGRDKEGVLTIIELKRVKASKEAVLQLKKYMDVIDLDAGRRVRAILVAPEIGKGVQELLSSLGYEYKELSPQICADVLKKRRGKALSEFFRL